MILLRALLWLLALPAALLRFLVTRVRSKPLVLELLLEGAHPLRPKPAALLRPRASGLARRAIVQALEQAAKDPRVRTVSVRVGALTGGAGELEDLRAALRRVRDAGRRVVAFVAHPDLRALWVASAADEVLASPGTPFMVHGLALEMSFLGETLDRVGVGFEVLAAGRYKSAMEPLTRTEPSPESREALEALLDDLYERRLADIAAGRRLTVDAVRAAIEGGPHLPEAALAAGLVDALVEEEDVRARLGCGEDGPARAVALRAYGGPIRPWPRWKGPRGPRVALVEVHGTIREGHEAGGPERGASAAAVVRHLERARKDRRIRGVLLHVDSRGGSATASERMWRAVRRVAAEKPVVACFADYAASGGYYVGSAAHAIVSAPGTLTGSIGVIMGKPVADRLLARLGVHRVRLERGPRASMFSLSRRLRDDERGALGATIEHFYALFLRRVGEGRGRAAEAVAPVAEGRVWTGAQALAHGLVDRLGDSEDALRLLAERAGLTRPPVLVALGPRGPLLQRVVQRLGVAEIPGLALLDLASREAVLAWCPVEIDG